MKDPLRNIAPGEEADAIGWRDAEIERLRGLLRKYGTHAHDCSYDPSSWNDGPWPCDCGFLSALGAADQPSAVRCSIPGCDWTHPHIHADSADAGCPECNGTGFFKFGADHDRAGQPCRACGGTGSTVDAAQEGK